MTIHKTLLVLCSVVALFAAGSAHAGPKVMVTFKNNAIANASYIVETSNEASTNLNAAPKPAVTVNAGVADTYAVQSNISPDSNFASVRYKVGGKTCAFTTTYVNTYNSSGIKVPSWNKTSTPSGGATCTATITSTNFTSHEWSVEFAMK
uniref:hypothetical protein n=1 Tax=Pseudomonas laurentiana TaxID=2364649 RepID=UPI0029C70E6F|nr:hypothetical protein [Pseudomonas laurentiana]